MENRRYRIVSEAQPHGRRHANSENVFIVGVVSFGNSDGIEGEGTLDKTWQEIYDAMQSKICIIVITMENHAMQALITSVGVDLDGNYIVLTSNITKFSTDTPNGYPAGGGGK